MTRIRSVKNISLGAFAAACITVAGGGIPVSANQQGQNGQQGQNVQSAQHNQGGQNGQNGQGGQGQNGGGQGQGGQNGQQGQSEQQRHQEEQRRHEQQAQGGQNVQGAQHNQNGQNGQGGQGQNGGGQGQGSQNGQQGQSEQQAQGATSGDSRQMGQQDHTESRMARADRMMSEMHMANAEFMQQMDMHMSSWDESMRYGLDTRIHEIMMQHQMNIDQAIAEYKMHIAQGMNHDEAHNMLINRLDSHKAHAMNQMHEARNHWIDWANNHSNGMVTGEEKDHFINKFNHTMDWFSNKMEHIKSNQ